MVLGRIQVAVRLRPRNAEELVADADFADCVKLQPEVKEEDDANAARKLQINLKQRRRRNQCCQKFYNPFIGFKYRRPYAGWTRFFFWENIYKVHWFWNQMDKGADLRL